MTYYDLTNGSWLYYQPSGSGLTLPFERIWSLRPELPQTAFLYGKNRTFPRRFKAYGHDYHFSGKQNVADPVPPELQPFLDYATRATGKVYNGILVNWYKDGSDYISAHSDDEPDLDQVPIFSWSFGGSRTFRLRPKFEPKPEWLNGNFVDIPLHDGTLVVMSHEMQGSRRDPERSERKGPGGWTHEIPKTKQADRRISITVRRFVSER